MLKYCKKCGRVVSESEKCDYCNSITYPVPEKYWLDGLDFLITNEQKQLLREELVKTSEEFDPYLFEHRGPDLARRDAETYAVLNIAFNHKKNISEGRNKGNPTGIECPYCHSANVKKISTTSRMISTWLVGLASEKIGKQWHCNQCGSDF